MSLAQATIRMIDKYGSDMILRKQDKGVYDRTTRTYPSPGSVVEYPFRGREYPYSQEDYDSGKVRVGDMRIATAPGLFEDSSVQPTDEDVVVVETKTYRINRVSVVKLSGEIVRYNLFVNGISG